MSGTNHTVADGEDISTIAAQYGWVDWEPIWRHSNNKALREQRPNPFALQPKDKVFVPEQKPKTFKVPTGAKHVFQIRAPRVRFHIQMKDEFQAPYANTRYELKVGSETFEGSTTEEGDIEHMILPEEHKGELKLWLTEEPRTWKLKLGHLAPIAEKDGVKARLANMGLLDAAADDDQLLAALNDLLAQADKPAMQSVDNISSDAKAIIAELYGEEPV